jgi:hypothetical protein
MPDPDPDPLAGSGRMADMKAAIIVPSPESRAGEWAGLKAVPVLPNEDQLRALRWSRRALSEAWGRCANSTMDAFGTWTAAVEGVWWVLALDEELAAQIGQPYTDARSDDPCGKIVAGMRWLRNRHAHEIFVTGQGGPKRDFLGKPGDGYMFFISPSNCWMTSAEINPARDESRPHIRQRYDDYVAGLPLEHSLYQAAIWFDRVFSACGFPELQPPQDKAVL